MVKDVTGKFIRDVSRELRGHGFSGRPGLLRRPALDGFHILVWMRRLSAPVAVSPSEAARLLTGRAWVSAIDIEVFLHAPEMHEALGWTASAVPDFESMKMPVIMMPSDRVAPPASDGSRMALFYPKDLPAEGWSPPEVCARTLETVRAFEQVVGSRERAIRTWSATGSLPNVHPDDSAACVAYLLGLHGQFEEGEAILRRVVARLDAEGSESSSDCARLYEARIGRLRELVARGEFRGGRRDPTRGTGGTDAPG